MHAQYINRFEEFRQIKAEIRGSSNHLIVGIDIAKHKHYAFLGTATGKTVCKRLVFDNSMDVTGSGLTNGCLGKNLRSIIEARIRTCPKGFNR